MKKKAIERYYQDLLIKAYYPCQKEVIVPSGRIDILSSNYIIEIKEYSKWKDGIGQLQSYSEYYPNHKKLLYLFQTTNNVQLMPYILDICKKNKIELTISFYEEPKELKVYSLQIKSIEKEQNQ